jgi:hypothetical protein
MLKRLPHFRISLHSGKTLTRQPIPILIAAKSEYAKLQ